MRRLFAPLLRLSSYLRIYLRMALLVLLRRPYKLSLLIAGGCNLRCQVCSIWRAPKTTLTLADVRRIWDEFPIKPCWVNISGGEPTLNPELEAILSFFVGLRRPLLITLTSNGYADCSALIARVLAKNTLTVLYVSISIDGNEPDHNLARGRARSFSRALACYEKLCSLQADFAWLEVGVSTTLSRVNLPRMLPFIQRMLESKTALSVNLAQASEYYLNAAEDSFQRLPRRELVNLLKAIEFLLPKLSLHSLLKVSFLHGAIAHLEGKYTPVPCTSYQNNLLVSSELDLLNCTVRFEPWTAKDASRESKLAAISSSIREPRRRMRVLRAQIRTSGCEQTCHTPCESYVHTISALLDPRWAPRLLWTYLVVCLESLFIGERHVRRVLSQPARALVVAPVLRT